MKRRIYLTRLRVEKWLWSGPRRAAIAKRLPLVICDVDGAYYKRKLRDPDWVESMWPEARTWAAGTTTVLSWPWDGAR